MEMGAGWIIMDIMNGFYGEVDFIL